jgi:hypothetical protein
MFVTPDYTNRIDAPSAHPPPSRGRWVWYETRQRSGGDVGATRPRHFGAGLRNSWLRTEPIAERQIAEERSRFTDGTG